MNWPVGGLFLLLIATGVVCFRARDQWVLQDKEDLVTYTVILLPIIAAIGWLGLMIYREPTLASRPMATGFGPSWQCQTGVKGSQVCFDYSPETKK